MPLDPQRYADDCIAGLNSEVSRQTIVIDPADLPAPLLGIAIGIIEQALPALHLRVRKVEAPARYFAEIPALKSAVTAGARRTAPTDQGYAKAEKIKLIL